MNSLEDFLTSKRAIVKFRKSGWIKAMHLLAVHEKRQNILARNNQPSRTSTTIASHRRKIEKRIRDLQTLTIEIWPGRGDHGELTITVKTEAFPRPIPIRRFFTNPLYIPAFQITKHDLFLLMRFIDSMSKADRGIDENGNEDSDRFDFYGWDGKSVVIKVWESGKSSPRERGGRSYLISPIENRRFNATEVSSRVIRTAVQTNPAPASVVQRAKAWIAGRRFHKPSPVRRAGELQAVVECFNRPAE